MFKLKKEASISKMKRVSDSISNQWCAHSWKDIPLNYIFDIWTAFLSSVQNNFWDNFAFDKNKALTNGLAL